MESGKQKDWEQNGIKYAKRAHDEAYFAGFHRGRQKQREKWVNCGWLQVNPLKEKELQEALRNPCDNCVNRADYLKIGCKSDPKQCELKQRQNLAIEIATYFKHFI